LLLRICFIIYNYFGLEILIWGFAATYLVYVGNAKVVNLKWKYVQVYHKRF